MGETLSKQAQNILDRARTSFRNQWEVTVTRAGRANERYWRGGSDLKASKELVAKGHATLIDEIKDTDRRYGRSPKVFFTYTFRLVERPNETGAARRRARVR